MDHWFNDCLGPTLKKLDLQGKAERIDNVDKSGFSLSWTSKMILTKRGHKMPHALIQGLAESKSLSKHACQLLAKSSHHNVVYKGA